MTSRVTAVTHQPSVQTDDDDDDQANPDALPFQSKLSVEQGESRLINIPEAVGLDFNSFIPQADITSQVHFLSNIHPDSAASLAGLRDGDRILQINGVNVTNLEHEDVRKLMQLMSPIVLTVANDQKYLLLLQEPVVDVEEKAPELPILSADDQDKESISARGNRFELRRRPSQESMASSVFTSAGSTKVPRYEIFNLTEGDETTKEEPLKGKLCRLRKSKNYDGYGLVLTFQKHLHIIGQVEKTSPSYRAGLRENDVILFVGKVNIEKLSHDDVKVMIRVTTLAAHSVELTVISKYDMPKYKTLQEKGLIDWSLRGLEK